MNAPAPYGPETMHADRSDHFRRVIDANLYMTIATADEVGSPWASPVYFAHAGHREFIWVSKPGARHSRNIATRPQVGIAVFDSHAPIGTGGGVYVEATAEQLFGDDRLAALGVFSRAASSTETGRSASRTSSRRPRCGSTARPRASTGCWTTATCGSR